MEWVSIDDYLPGKKCDANKIIVLLSNGEVSVLGSKNIKNISNPWVVRSGDGETFSASAFVTHWMPIKMPNKG